MIRRLLLGVLAGALLLGVAPAQADAGSASVAGIDGVLYDDCLAHPYSFTVASVPADAGYWDLRTRLVGPDGHLTATDFVAQPTSTGTSTFGLLCPPRDTYGRYTIQATFEWQGSDSAWHSSPLPDAHFTLRRPHTRTSLAASTRRPGDRQVVTWQVRSSDERPTGYAPNAFAWVHLEKRVSGQWVRIRGGRAMTHATGQVKVRLRYLGHHRRTWVRAVTERSARFARSTSPAVRLW